MIEIKPCTITEIEMSGLADEYASYAVDGLPAPNPQWDCYRQMEAQDAICSVGAYESGKLIGFIVMLVHVSLHYGVKIAMAESIFVAHEYRKTGAGIKLIRSFDQFANMSQAKASIVTAPTGGELDKVLSKAGYINTHTTYVKAI